jgi:hypothetical protein
MYRSGAFGASALNRLPAQRRNLGLLGFGESRFASSPRRTSNTAAPGKRMGRWDT